MNTFHCIAVTAPNGAQSLYYQGKGKGKGKGKGSRPMCFVSKEYTTQEIKRLKRYFPDHEYEYACVQTALNFLG